MKKEQLAKTIKDIRQKSGASQRVFALKLDVTKNTVQNWEYGKFQPTKANVRTMIKTFSLKKEEYPELFEFSDYVPETNDESAVADISEKKEIVAEPNEKVEYETISFFNCKDERIRAIAIRLKKWSPIIKTVFIAACAWFICWITLLIICVCHLAPPIDDEAVTVTSYACVNSPKIALYSVLSFFMTIALSAFGRILFDKNRSRKSKTAVAALSIIFAFIPFMTGNSLPQISSDDSPATGETFESVENTPSSYLFARLDLYIYYAVSGKAEVRLSCGFSLFSSKISVALRLYAFDEQTADTTDSNIMYTSDYVITENLITEDLYNISTCAISNYYWVAYAAFYNGNTIEVFNTEPRQVHTPLLGQ